MIIECSGFKRKQNSNTKKVILMDEVDGMSSGDRGGIQELVSYVCMNDIKIKIIKTTQTPIICICNDRDSSKVRTLANNCYDLLFTKPSPYLFINLFILVWKFKPV